MGSVPDSRYFDTAYNQPTSRLLSDVPEVEDIKTKREAMSKEAEEYIQSFKTDSPDGTLSFDAMVQLLDGFALELLNAETDEKYIDHLEQLPDMLKRIIKMQMDNYGDGMTTHLQLISLCKEADKLIKRFEG